MLMTENYVINCVEVFFGEEIRWGENVHKVAPEWFGNSTPAVPATSSDTATVMDCSGDYSVTVLAIILVHCLWWLVQQSSPTVHRRPHKPPPHIGAYTRSRTAPFITPPPSRTATALICPLLTAESWNKSYLDLLVCIHSSVLTV